MADTIQTAADVAGIHTHVDPNLLLAFLALLVCVLIGLFGYLAFKTRVTVGGANSRGSPKSSAFSPAIVVTTIAFVFLFTANQFVGNALEPVVQPVLVSLQKTASNSFCKGVPVNQIQMVGIIVDTPHENRGNLIGFTCFPLWVSTFADPMKHHNEAKHLVDPLPSCPAQGLDCYQLGRHLDI